VVALAREVLGGNGVQADFHVAKQFCDMEAIYTYEVRGLGGCGHHGGVRAEGQMLCEGALLMFVA
jgi:hypothetical protein